MASKRNARRRGCTGKRSYFELGHAYAAQRGHAKTFGETLGIYWCSFCRRYHLGHPFGPKRTRANFKEMTL